MNTQDIEEINKKCPSDQGIFFQPWGIPTDVKELVIYGRYETGGMTGGSCWNDEEPHPYSNDPPDDRLEVLSLTLEKLMPNISYLQYKKISKLIHNNEETEREYYGNSTDLMIEYIILSELESFINELNQTT